MSLRSSEKPSGPQGMELAGSFGSRILAMAERLAEWSDTPGLTCTYMTPAHRSTAAQLHRWMLAAGLTAEIDAIGNVVGRIPASDPAARTVIVGSHYDTVVNAGKYDGRLGILIALAVMEHIKKLDIQLPFNLELIAFAEEEGVRFSIPYIGSSAIAGRFDPNLLERTDRDGLRLGDILRAAGCDPTAIPALARPPKSLRAYLEVHIEQGPVLLEKNVPLGVVTAIAGGIRRIVKINGTPDHAGTTPMAIRRDALAAAAEIVLFVERRCSEAPGLVGTVGRLEVPNGAINVIPGSCILSLDIRAADDATRDAAIADVRQEIDGIAARRRVTFEISEIMRAPAVPCAAELRAFIADAVVRAGIPVVELPSGAGHDAVMFDGLTDIGMLFVRCGNGGISHSPRETVTADDVDLAARVMLDVLVNLV